MYRIFTFLVLVSFIQPITAQEKFDVFGTKPIPKPVIETRSSIPPKYSAEDIERILNQLKDAQQRLEAIEKDAGKTNLKGRPPMITESSSLDSPKENITKPQNVEKEDVFALKNKVVEIPKATESTVREDKLYEGYTQNGWTWDAKNKEWWSNQNYILKQQYERDGWTFNSQKREWSRLIQYSEPQYYSPSYLPTYSQGLRIQGYSSGPFRSFGGSISGGSCGPSG